MKSHPSIKHTFVLLAALILCGLTSQAHTTQDSTSRWTLHLQAGFGENCAEALSWGGSDALLWTGQIGLRYSLSPRFSVGASIGMHDQFLTSRPHPPHQRTLLHPPGAATILHWGKTPPIPLRGREQPHGLQPRHLVDRRRLPTVPSPTSGTSKASCKHHDNHLIRLHSILKNIGIQK